MKIDQFVEETFCKHVPVENVSNFHRALKIRSALTRPPQVIWFRNWRSLKSVHAVEHFHIMLNRPHAEFIKRITNGDVPLAAKVGIAASSE